LQVKVKIDSDLVYRDADDCDAHLNMLDVYHGRQGSVAHKPVALFIHGGDWSAGDKSCVFGVNGGMAHWFVAREWIFVSMNFRLVSVPQSPTADIPDLVDDVAKAIKWVSINIRRYGGDPSRITLVGYSSGAHLAALVACDPVYLKHYRLTNVLIEQIVCLDGAHFDIQLSIRLLSGQDLGLTHQDHRVRKLRRLMGDDEARQCLLSPASHPLSALGSIRFLLVSAGRQGGAEQCFTKLTNESFARQLREAGVPVKHAHFAAIDHRGLLLMHDEALQQCVEAFFRRSE